MIRIRDVCERVSMIRIIGRSGVLTASCAAALPACWRISRLVPCSQNAEMNARTITTLLFQAKPGAKADFSGKYPRLSRSFRAQLQRRQPRTFGFLRDGFHRRQSQGRGSFAYAARSFGADARRSFGRQSDRRDDPAADDLFRPSNNTLDAPHFSGANLTEVHVQAELSGSDFRGADLSRANFYPLEGRPGEGTLATAYRNILKYCDFSGARLRDANMERAVLWFAKFNGADLKGVELHGCRSFACRFRRRQHFGRGLHAC